MENTIDKVISNKLKNKEELAGHVLMENKITSASMLKIEPEWDNFKVEHIPETFMCEQDKPELISIVSLKKNEECILDSSNKISGTVLDRSKDLSPEQIEVSVKTENCETIGEIGKRPEIVFVECKIKGEEVDLKHEDLEQNEISSPSGGINQEKHTVYKKHRCHMCDYQTDVKGHFSTHLLRHENLEEVGKFKCDQCDYKTIEKGCLKRHLLRHKNPEELSIRCDKCDFKTIHKHNLKRHLQLHQDPAELDLFKCDNCESGALWKKVDLNQQLLRRNSLEEVDQYKCNQCGYKTLLVRNVSKPVRIFICDTCDYKTNRKPNLERHLLRHRDPAVELFKCDECKYRTLGKTSLKKHLLQHNRLGEVNWLHCNQCDYGTTASKALKIHLLLHEYSRRGNEFRCDKCDYKTTHKRNLKRHLLLHLNPEEFNLFKCYKCEFQTRWKSNLKKHVLKHGRVDEVD